MVDLVAERKMTLTFSGLPDLIFAQAAKNMSREDNINCRKSMKVISLIVKDV